MIAGQSKTWLKTVLWQ